MVKYGLHVRVPPKKGFVVALPYLPYLPEMTFVIPLVFTVLTLQL
jgi:hypothetical protein